MLIFLFFAFVAAFAMFHVGKHQLNTPFLFNLLGSFCIWAAIFCIGGAFAPSNGPWASGGEDGLVLRSYTDAVKYLALAVLGYGMPHVLQRVIAKRQKRNGNN